MKIAIGSDHGGYVLKGKLINFLKDGKYVVEDFGSHSKDACDYPQIGFEVARAVSEGRAERGVLICRTGIGMAIIANKLPGVRAGACYDEKMARSSREHNDTNVLVLAADYTPEAEAKKMTKIWLTTKALGDRHARRVKQIEELELKNRKRSA